MDILIISDCAKYIYLQYNLMSKADQLHQKIINMETASMY
jgi:hypothetical protein